MRTMQTILAFTVLIMAIFTLGCAKPPTEEMEKAVEAVARAENDNNAVTYAANSISRARDALARMHVEAASKNYDAAKSYAAEAISIAERAINEGKAGADRARNEAAALVAEIKPMVIETERGINTAKAAGLPLNFEDIAVTFSIASSSAEQSEIALNNGRYDDSLKMGRSARSDLNSINQKLSNAVISVSRKK